MKTAITITCPCYESGLQRLCVSPPKSDPCEEQRHSVHSHAQVSSGPKKSFNQESATAGSLKVKRLGLEAPIHRRLDDTNCI
jgi:hypothetical protein